MASRSTRRPITPLVPSICSIVSAGTRRRRREKRPDFTDSASGTSGAVPYIGHSTLPTSRPCLSATMYPAVRRRSMAIALMWATLFPPCKDSCGVAVKDLLTQPGFLPTLIATSLEWSRAGQVCPRNDHEPPRATRGRPSVGLASAGDEPPQLCHVSPVSTRLQDGQVLLHFPICELHAVL